MDGTYVTLNIGASDIRLLSTRGREVQKWSSLSLSPGLVRDGLILQPKVVATVIGALFESTGASKERVIVCLTGLPFTYRILRLPRMKPAVLREAIERAARKEMQLPLEDLYLSWQAVGGGRDEQDFFVLGVPRRIIDAVVQTLAEAGVKPYLIDIKPLALARAAGRGDAIIVDLERDCFDIVLVVNGMVSIMHTMVPRGGASIVEDNIQRLADELSKTVDFYNTGHPQNPLSPNTPLLLTGDLSTDTRSSELIQAATGYPVEPLVPPYKLPADLPVALFASNIGLAVKKLPLRTTSKRNTYLFRDININILSDKYGVKASGVKLADILLTLALLITIGLLYPVYDLRSQAATEAIRLQTESANLQQELDKRLVATGEAKLIESTIDEITARAERMKGEQQNILNKRVEFANDLEFVTGILPDKAAFTYVTVGSNQIIVEGKADSAFNVIGYVVALEESGKFPEVRVARIDDIKSSGTGTTKVETPGVSFNIIIGK